MARPKKLPERIELALGLDEAEDDATVRDRVAKKLGVRDPAELPPLYLRRRSLDARGRRVRVRLDLAVGGEDPVARLGLPLPKEVSADGPDVVIIGGGPAGLFCAYELARHGVRSTVLDRGKQVQPRRRDLAQLNRAGKVDPDSNYCFGEGGAGTYSDGKLYTRSGKRGDVRDVIETLALHGAPEQILTDARPHIGSNRLPKVVTAMRERLEACGVSFRYGARVDGMVRHASGEGGVRAVRLADGEELPCDALVVATGHSARDVYRWLDAAGVVLEPKGFALGVRIEHPQTLINQIQYGRDAGHPKLPAAAYRLAHTADDGRGVFSFCMCPGGFIVPAATEPGGQVVNGMSLSKRGSAWANSGLVVAIEPEDWVAAGYGGSLGGVDLQRAIEEAAFDAGGGALVAPATRVDDFLAGRGSSTVPETSYQPGLLAGDISEVLDAGGVPLAARLREGLGRFGKRMKGYHTGEAVMLGVESRTSAPVRVPRDKGTLESPDVPGLFPCGEGAGFAGGIVSAAIDGQRVAGAILESLGVGEAQTGARRVAPR